MEKVVKIDFRSTKTWKVFAMSALLLTWFNFNPNMDNKSHARQ